MKQTLLRPLLLAAIVVSMVAPTAIASAQGWRRHPHEGMIITVNPGMRRIYRHSHWVVVHRHRYHGAWVWR